MRPGFGLPLWLVIGLASAALLLGEMIPRQAAWTHAAGLAAQVQTSEQPADAVARARQALELAPWRADLWEQLGISELAAGRGAEAGKALREAQRRGRLSAAGRVAFGDVLLEEGDRVGALQTWRAVLADGWVWGELYERICQVERASGDLQGALNTAMTWRTLQADSAAANYQTGVLLLALQQEGGIPALLAAAQADPDDAGKVEVIRKGHAQAMTAQDPARRLLLIGRGLGSAGEWDLARHLFEQAIQVEPEYAEAWAYLGEARQRLGEDGAAELERALRLDPRSLSARAFMAMQLRRRGDYQRAMDYVERIIEQEPDQGMWYMEAGATMADSGDLVTALAYYQRATRVEPKAAASWQALAGFSINYEVDVAGIGLPAARQALELAPNDPDGLDLMGWAFLKLGDLTSAERFLQHALAEQSRHPSAHLHLGQVYLEQGQNEGARSHLEMAARMDGEGAIGRLANRLLERYFPSG